MSFKGLVFPAGAGPAPEVSPVPEASPAPVFVAEPTVPDPPRPEPVPDLMPERASIGAKAFPAPPPRPVLTPPLPLPMPKRRSRRAWLVPGIALLALVVILLRPHGHPPSPTPSPTPLPPPPPAAAQFTTGTGGDEHTVYNYGLAILSESQPFTFFSPKTNKNETWTPEIRAGRLAYRLNDNLGDVKGMIGGGVSPEDAVKNVLQGTLSGDPVIYFKYGKPDGDKMGDLILTVDAQTAADCGCPDAARLSCWWRDLLRDYLLINLGRPPLYPLDAAGNPNPPAPLQDLSTRLQKAAGQGPPDERAFHAVYSDLLLPANQKSYNDLQTLYKTLPPGYVATPDPVIPLNLRREDDMQ